MVKYDYEQKYEWITHIGNKMCIVPKLFVTKVFYQIKKYSVVL